MRGARDGDSRALVELLAKDYQSRHRSQADQTVAKIGQDFIGRGLFNTTVRVGDQLQADISYIHGLIDHVLESIELHLDSISFSTSKEILLRIVDEEYKRVMPRVTARLVESGLANKEIIGDYDRAVQRYCEDAKSRIEIRFAAWEKEQRLHERVRERWYQSRKIQGALIGSVTAIVLAIVGWSFLYGERVLVEVLPSSQDYIHVYSVSRGAQSGLIIERVAAWRKIRVNNRSNKRVSLVDAFFQEHAKLEEQIPRPFFERVAYAANRVSLEGEVSLPIQFEPWQVKEFFVLLPVSVSETMGKLLVNLMRNEGNQIETSAQTSSPSDNPLAQYERSVLEGLRASKSASLIDYKAVLIHKIRIDRLIGMKDGKFSFSDLNNCSDDGFVFVEASELHRRVVDRMLEETNVTYPMLGFPFTKYDVILKSGNGKPYTCTLRTGDLLFDLR